MRVIPKIGSDAFSAFSSASRLVVTDIARECAVGAGACLRITQPPHNVATVIEYARLAVRHYDSIERARAQRAGCVRVGTGEHAICALPRLCVACSIICGRTGSMRDHPACKRACGGRGRWRTARPVERIGAEHRAVLAGAHLHIGDRLAQRTVCDSGRCMERS